MLKSKTLRIQAVAAVTAMLLVSFMVVRTSSAAFSGQTESTPTSPVTASTVYFDGVGELPFDSGDGLIPGDAIVECVEVTYAGSEFDDLNSVQLTVPSWTAENGTDDVVSGSETLADVLGITDDGTTLLTDGTDGTSIANLTVAVGDASVTCATLESDLSAITGDLLGAGTLANGTDIYDGAMADFDGVDTDTAWTPTSGDSVRAFAFRVSIPSGADNQLQGDSVTGTFTWSVDATAS